MTAFHSGDRQSKQTELSCLLCVHVIIGYGDEEQCSHQHLQVKVLLYGTEQRLNRISHTQINNALPIIQTSNVSYYGMPKAIQGKGLGVG